MKDIWLYRGMSLIWHFNMLVKDNLHSANSCMDYFYLYILLTGSFMLQFIMIHVTYVLKRVSGISVVEFAVFVKL